MLVLVCSGAGSIPKLPEDVILVDVDAASVLFAVKVSAFATSGPKLDTVTFDFSNF